MVKRSVKWIKHSSAPLVTKNERGLRAPFLFIFSIGDIMERPVRIVKNIKHGKATYKAQVLHRFWFFGWRHWWDWFTVKDCEGDSWVVVEDDVVAIENRVRAFYTNSGPKVVKEFTV